MKKLTIEQKAKAYDEAVSKLRRFMAQGVDPLITRADVQDFFPELAESEDERIRKEIIYHIKNCDDTIDEKTEKRMVAWLEKQEEHQDYPKDVIDNAISFLANRNDGMPIEEAKDIVNAIITVLNPSYWPKQGEQKPVKVEPKFKVGDFIIYNRFGKDELYNIVKINERGYYVNMDDVPNGILDFKDELFMRLWTIQDAKPGDVLEFGDHGRLVVGIVSFISKRTGRVDVYCLLEANNFKVGNYYALDTINPHPATKEQRDTLFAKIKEAGYEWDAEKKELKKMEQNPWSEEDENKRKLCFQYLTSQKNYQSSIGIYQWMLRLA